MKTMQRTALVVAGAFAAGVLCAAAALAHHSTAAFNNEKVLKIDGTITEFRWINPHASIKINGKVEGAPDGLWTIEMTAPNVLINEGWKRNSVRPGDHVTMFVSPLKHPITLKDGSQGALYVGVVLANGSTLGRVDGKPAPRHK